MEENTADVLIATLKKRDFYLEEPKSSLLSPWAWVLIAFPAASTLGLAFLTYFGFRYIQNQAPTAFEMARLSNLSAWCLALGEIGSFFAAIEVFRKYGRRETVVWDWVCVVVSGITTAIAASVGQAWMSGSEVWWGVGLKVHGPLLLSALAVLDTVLAGSEAGLYLAQGNERHKRWEKELEKWARRQEALIKRFQELQWSIQERQIEFQLKQQEQMWKEELKAWGQPAQPTQECAEPTPEQQKASECPCCYCGMPVYPIDYEQHCREVHYPEVAEHATAREAYDALISWYSMNGDGDWPLPTLTDVVKWRREVGVGDC